MKSIPLSKRYAKRLCTIAIAATLGLGVAAPAHAEFLSILYTQILNQLQDELLGKLLALVGLDTSSAVVQSSAAVRAEILKGATADMMVQQGMEQYRQQVILQRLAIKTSSDLEQPVTTCATISASTGIATATLNTKLNGATMQRGVLKRMGSNTNTMAEIESSYNATNAVSCTPAEQAQGICTVTNQQMAGADQSAAMLYMGSDGSSTYSGGPSGDQAKAVKRYIDRVASVAPPEQLRSSESQKTPQGRAYTELMRRYNAMISMGTYSLSQISQSRMPQPGLGKATGMADVKASGFARGKTDMSMIEAVERLVATKFSADSVVTNAGATSPNLLLRDIAQMTSFRLWMDHQSLLQEERTEAIMAHQLALLTEQTLRPQLDAQRAAASRTISR